MALGVSIARREMRRFSRGVSARSDGKTKHQEECMAPGRAYLDWNATAPMLSSAREAVLAAMDLPGNASSIHAEGRAARAVTEAARRDVAALVGGDPENVVFTSGATEAINAVIRSGVLTACAIGPGGKPLPGPVLVSAVEHAAVFAALDSTGRERVVLPVGADGVVRADALDEALAPASAPGVAPLVMIQLANNETGIVQPIAALAEIVHARGGVMVVDAVQGPGRLPIDIEALGADVLILSAHKFGGPKGVGALVFSRPEVRLAQAFLAGGGQERGQRGGTENLAGIAGMGAAAKSARAAFAGVETMIQLRDDFENRLNRLAPDVVIVGEGVLRLANTCCFAIPGLSAAQALIAFDLDGVAVSSGSACSSGKVKSSHVLEAMGQPHPVREGAIRVSIGPTTQAADMDRCVASLERQLARRRTAGNSATAA